MRSPYFQTRSADVVEVETDYVLSDSDADRMDDIIEASGWQLSTFAPVALFNHHKDAIIGEWLNVRVVGKQLIARLRLAEEGTSAVVDMVRKLIRQKLLEGVSVGFRPLEAEARDKRDPWAGTRFIKAELLEGSLVAVAANPRARRIVKEFLPDTDVDLLFATSGENDRRRSLSVRGKAAETHSRSGSRPVKISERIVNRKNAIVAIRDKLAAIAKRIEDSDGDIGDDDSREQEALSAELKDGEEQLRRLEALEKDIKATADDRQHNDDGGDGGDRDRERHRDIVVRGSDMPMHYKGDPNNPFRQIAQQATGFELLVKMYRCHLAGYVHRKSPLEIAAELYKGHRQLRDLDMVLKATSAPAMTNVVGWAAELVGPNVQAVLESLIGLAVYPQIASRGLVLTFPDGYSPIVIPARQYGTVPGGAAPTDRNRRLSGAFVGEGQPIPVRQALFIAKSITPNKLAVISTFTREMAMSAAIEQIIREAILEDTAWALDYALLSDEAAQPNIRPAGIFNGVAPIPPAVAGPDAPLTDLKALLSAIIAIGGGRRLLFIMNPLQGLTLTTMLQSGVFLFRDEMANGRILSTAFMQSTNVPIGEIYLIDCADFASGTGAPNFDVSDQATLHMDDGSYPADFTAPDVKPIVAGTMAAPVPAAPVRSMFQTASIAVRMIMPASWAMRRPGMVAHMEGVNW